MRRLKLFTIPSGIILITFFIALALIVSGCGKKSGDTTLVELKGGIKGGGTMTTNETENIRSLDPTGINDVVSHHVAHQLYDLLVDLDSNMNLKPQLAMRWEISEDGLTYTFHLRKGVFFHDNACFPGGKGREFTAQDVKYSFDRIQDPRTGSLGFDYYKNYVEGAAEFTDEVTKSITESREPMIKDVKGYIVKDDSTFVIKLKKPFGPFIYYMCLGFSYIIPKEAVEKYGKDFFQNPVGTGPFVFENWTPDLEINMKKNPNYWEKDEFGNSIPYLDKVKFRFIKDLSQQLLEFKNGSIDDCYRIPTELTQSVMNEDGTLTPEYSQFVLQRKNAYAIQYYGFLTSGKIFNNPKVRQAFNFAIDRDRIIKYVLKGVGMSATHGIVPPSMPGYDINNIKGYSYDFEKAKQLLSEAGYPGGKGFPEVTLNINEGGGRNTQIMEALQDMIKKLGVPIKVQTLQFAQHLDNIDAGRSDFYRLGWVADYPDPENFLNLFYGKNIPQNPADKSPINSFRWRNATYDELFEKALKISDRTERYKIYQQAEQIAVDEAPMLFIFYDVDLRLVQSYIRGYALDPMHRVNMRYTWIDK